MSNSLILEGGRPDNFSMSLRRFKKRWELRTIAFPVGHVPCEVSKPTRLELYSDVEHCFISWWHCVHLRRGTDSTIRWLSISSDWQPMGHLFIYKLSDEIDSLLFFIFISFEIPYLGSIRSWVCLYHQKWHKKQSYFVSFKYRLPVQIYILREFLSMLNMGLNLQYAWNK